jgi:peptide chain release factor subunit 1
MFSHTELQELLAFEAGDSQALSFYANVDAGQQPRETIKQQARGLLREAPDELAADVAAIEKYLDLSHDWSKPGLAIFSCQAQDFFRVYPAAVPFRNRLRVGAKPYVKPLAHLLDHYAHYGVVLVDRVGARFFEFHLGELQHTGGFLGEDVRKLKHGGGMAAASGMRGGASGDRAEDETAARNLREAATAAVHFFEHKDIRRLFLGGTTETVSQFRDLLPRRLQSCLAGTFAIEMNASEHEVRDRSLALLTEANDQREKKLVETMIGGAAQGGAAVTGLADTLTAVSEGRVQTLVVSDGFKAAGLMDKASRTLLDTDAGYGQENGQFEAVDDVVEAAVARAMSHGGHVEIISDNPNLERVGRIGALLFSTLSIRSNIFCRARA